MLRATAATAVVVALAAGCSSAASSPTAAAPSAEAGVLPSGHVHGVAIDPGYGALLLATHEGLIEVGADGGLRPTGPVIDLMGFTVVGPDHYLASGHPGLRVDLPQPVGLIESTDGGRTWEPLSRQGQSDFHALAALAPSGALGWDGALQRTADGHTWEQLAIPAEPHTLSAAPDGTTVLATTAQGLLRSADAAPPGLRWTALRCCRSSPGPTTAPPWSAWTRPARCGAAPTATAPGSRERSWAQPRTPSQR